jgi:hypothetical protein
VAGIGAVQTLFGQINSHPQVKVPAAILTEGIRQLAQGRALVRLPVAVSRVHFITPAAAPTFVKSLLSTGFSLFISLIVVMTSMIDTKRKTIDSAMRVIFI